MLLNREAILAADDLPYEDVEIPEWGGSVRVWQMDGLTRDKFRRFVAGLKETEYDNYRIEAWVAVHTVGDANRQMLFADSDIETLLKKSATALDKLAAVSLRVNVLAMPDVEALAKNSEPSPSGSGTSESA